MGRFVLVGQEEEMGAPPPDMFLVPEIASAAVRVLALGLCFPVVLLICLASTLQPPDTPATAIAPIIPNAAMAHPIPTLTPTLTPTPIRRRPQAPG